MESSKGDLESKGESKQKSGEAGKSVKFQGPGGEDAEKEDEDIVDYEKEAKGKSGDSSQVLNFFFCS